MADLLLIVRIAGERIAIPTAEVESVVEIDSVMPVPRAAPHVAGLAALKSRVLTVIDCAASLQPGARMATVRDAMVVVADGHPYALLVDGVEDVVGASGEAGPLPATLGGGWSRVGRAMVEVEGELLLQVDVRALIEGPAAPAVGEAALSL
jgi:purine-binding chemotaxis protein CheW